MAEYLFAEQSYKGGRIPTDSVAGKGILLYTSLFDSKLSAEISSAEEQGITSVVITAGNASTGNARQIWKLNEDYSAELLN